VGICMRAIGKPARPARRPTHLCPARRPTHPPPVQVSRGGVVRDPAVHALVVERVTSGICEFGFACRWATGVG
jgi:hypothetical protein